MRSRTVVLGAVVGSVPNVPLELHKGADLNFDIRWWADESKVTPVAIASAEAQIRTPDGDLLVDVQPTVSGNVVMVRVPAATTSAVEWTGQAVWDCEVVAAVSGERRKLARGVVRIYQEVTL